MDIFQGESLFAAMFSYQPSEPLNPEFGFFGIETLNFLPNSGSYFLAILAIMLFMVAKKQLNKHALKNMEKKWARQLGP